MLNLQQFKFLILYNKTLEDIPFSSFREDLDERIFIAESNNIKITYDQDIMVWQIYLYDEQELYRVHNGLSLSQAINKSLFLSSRVFVQVSNAN